MRDVGAAIARVDGGDDATEAGRRKQQGHPFQASDQPDRDHVALADTLPGQPGGDRIDPFFELRAGDADAAVATEGAVCTCAVMDQRCQRSRITTHKPLLLNCSTLMSDSRVLHTLYRT